MRIQGPIFPILSEHLALFIAYLAEKKYASSTVLTYVHTQATLYKRRLLQGMYAIAFFAALRIGEITCQPKQTNENLIFLNQASFMKRNGDSIDTIKLTLRHYKHSNPAEPVNVFIYQAQPVCPITCILKFKGNLSRSTFLLARSLSHFTKIFYSGLSRFPPFL